jgi:hypothetical protein
MCDITNNAGKILAGCCLLLASGCGGGGGTGAGAGAGAATQSPTATVTCYVSNKSTSQLVGLQFNAYLPSGVSVDTDINTKNVMTSKLVAGKALSGQTILGTYSSPILKVAISPKDATSLQNGFPQGEILKVICRLASSTGVTLDTFRAVNNSNPIPKDTLTGYAYNLSTKELLNITTSLSVVFANYSVSK